MAARMPMIATTIISSIQGEGTLPMNGPVLKDLAPGQASQAPGSAVDTDILDLTRGPADDQAIADCCGLAWHADARIEGPDDFVLQGLACVEQAIVVQIDRGIGQTAAGKGIDGVDVTPAARPAGIGVGTMLLASNTGSRN